MPACRSLPLFLLPSQPHVRRIEGLKPLRKFSQSLHLWLGLVRSSCWGSEILRLINPPARQTADSSCPIRPDTQSFARSVSLTA